MLNSAAGHLKKVAPCILYLGTRWAPQPGQWPYTAESFIRTQRVFRYSKNHLHFKENVVHILIHNSQQHDSKFSSYFLNIHRNMNFPFTSRSSRQSPYDSSPKPLFTSLLLHNSHTSHPVRSYLFEHLVNVKDIKKCALSENRSPDIQPIFKPLYSPSYPGYHIYYINWNMGAEMIIRVW
jgi:hypothetical protein